MAEQEPEDRQSRLTTALVLIAIGVVLLIGQVTQQWQWALLVLGIGFLVTYFMTRDYGFLVPGGILTGIGTGLLLATVVTDPPEDFEAALFLVPFGMGFVLIWVLDLIYTRASNWWPLIPGSIMIAIGVAVGVGGTALDVLALAGTWWPIILVLIGAWILYNLWREGELGNHQPKSDKQEWNE